MIDKGGYGEIHAGPTGTVYKTSQGDQWGRGDHAIIREAAALQVLARENQVIDLLGFGTCEGRPYMILPRILDPILSQVEYPYPACLSLWLVVALTIRRGHELGIFHRDIKPDNIFATSQGPLVFDYGLCHIRGQKAFPVDEDYCLGTPHIMAPEMILDPEHVPGPEQDYYQLGVLLHWLSEGDWPTPGDRHAYEVMRNVINGARLPMIRRPGLERARDLLMDQREFEPALKVVLGEIDPCGTA